MRTNFRSPLLFAVLIAAALLSPSARAQAPSAHVGETPRVELNYDYMHSNGPPGQCSCFNLNGAGGAFVYPLKPVKSLQHVPFALVGGFDVIHGSGIGNLGYNLTLFTYTAGARYTLVREKSRWRPYAEIRIGGAHAGGTLASSPSPAGLGIGNAFAGSMGGGVDVRWRPSISVKLLQVDYLATTFANGVNSHQNNLKISAGLVLHLH